MWYAVFMTESHSRSIAKAITYRAFGSLTTGLIFLFLNGSMKVALGAGVLDAVSKLVLYFLHERAWSFIPFGRKTSVPEYEI
jgi:uncharacterized membrane protein